MDKKIERVNNSLLQIIVLVIPSEAVGVAHLQLNQRTEDWKRCDKDRNTQGG